MLTGQNGEKQQPRRERKVWKRRKEKGKYSEYLTKRRPRFECLAKRPAQDRFLPDGAGIEEKGRGRVGGRVGGICEGEKAKKTRQSDQNCCPESHGCVMYLEKRLLGEALDPPFDSIEVGCCPGLSSSGAKKGERCDLLHESQRVGLSVHSQPPPNNVGGGKNSQHLEGVVQGRVWAWK